MDVILSLILSVLIAIFPFISELKPHKNFTDNLQIVTMAESGNDIILTDESGAVIAEDSFYEDFKLFTLKVTFFSFFNPSIISSTIFSS